MLPDTVGMVRPEQWRELLGRATVAGACSGVSPRRYPRDFRTFFGYSDALRAVTPRHDLPDPMPVADAAPLFADGAASEGDYRGGGAVR
jgi:hypothetical protein